MKNSRWVKRWEVQGSNDHVWIVAIDKNGVYGCSCPVWKFKRQKCHHIIQIKSGGGVEFSQKQKPEYVLACVNKPIFDEEKNRLLIPLIGLPDACLMEATIDFYLMKHGYSWGDVKKIRGHIPSNWTARDVINHVKTHGEAEYPEGWYSTNHKIKTGPGNSGPKRKD